jgi:8-oxo-dGTP diphosphatase
VKRIRVVAAVVRRGGALLVTRRPDRPDARGQWEFPGGKVEPGEDEPQALRREIAEELGCAVDVGPLLLRHHHRYPSLEVELAFYAARLADGAEPQALGVSELRWAAPEALPGLDFLEADLAVLGDIARAAMGADGW